MKKGHLKILDKVLAAELVSKLQHEDFTRIYKEERILKFTTFYQNTLHLTRKHCTTFYQSALHHEKGEDVTPSSRRPFSSELSKLIQSSDRISLEVGRVLLNVLVTTHDLILL